MIIKTGISAVDGETAFDITTPFVDIAIDFLQKHDHEGSSVGATITLETAEEVYSVFELLRNHRKVD